MSKMRYLAFNVWRDFKIFHNAITLYRGLFSKCHPTVFSSGYPAVGFEPETLLHYKYELYLFLIYDEENYTTDYLQ